MFPPFFVEQNNTLDSRSCYHVRVIVREDAVYETGHRQLAGRRWLAMISSSDDWTLSCRSGVTVLSPDRETVLSFDLEGRPISWFLGGTMYTAP